MKRDYKIVLAVAIIAIVVGSAYAARVYLFSGQASPLICASGALPYTTDREPTNQEPLIQQPIQASTSPSTIQVVAAENFWGSLVSQLGGNRTSVTSIISDPNTDPHEYESNAQDAQAISGARFVIVNGAGYDDWAIQIAQADNNPNQVVLNVANLLGQQPGVNPHFWYSPYYVNDTVHKMYTDLVNIDPAGASYYASQYVALNVSIGAYNAQINEIGQQFGGRRVASTESIFQYLANATHLDLISPYSFMAAVAEGNDPSPGCVALFHSQLLNPNSPGNATVLVYNEQTVTPLTQQLKAEAATNGIQIVGVTETIQPTDLSFQNWMGGELADLQRALNANALGQ
jgi:zinc/manganese transport system substrate-binding protein